MRTHAGSWKTRTYLAYVLMLGCLNWPAVMGSECQIRVVDGEIGGDTDECDVGVGRTEAIADANVGVVVVVLSGWEWEVVVLEVLGPTWGVS